MIVTTACPKKPVRLSTFDETVILVGLLIRTGPAESIHLQINTTHKHTQN